MTVHMTDMDEPVSAYDKQELHDRFLMTDIRYVKSSSYHKHGPNNAKEIFNMRKVKSMERRLGTLAELKATTNNERQYYRRQKWEEKRNTTTDM